MRLEKVHHGHRPREKLLLGFLRLVMRASPVGVIRTLLYRRDFFGDRMSRLTQQVMRGPSDWSPGERELFAAFVSRLNHCSF
jgi:hypothetical protein